MAACRHAAVSNVEGAAVEIETDRLRLRDGNPADIQGLRLGLNDPAIARWLVRPPFPYKIVDANDFIRLTQAATYSGFRQYRIVAERITDRLVDVVSLEPDRDRAELGYWLLTAAQGQGYIGEAASALIAAGAASLPDVNVVYARVRPTNQRSQAVLHRLHFSRVAEEHLCSTPGGHSKSWLFERPLRL